jgi:hypothetical protein
MRPVGLDGNKASLAELEQQGPDIHDALAEVRFAQEHSVRELLPHPLVAGGLSILSPEAKNERRQRAERDLISLFHAAERSISVPGGRLCLLLTFLQILNIFCEK